MVRKPRPGPSSLPTITASLSNTRSRSRSDHMKVDVGFNPRRPYQEERLTLPPDDHSHSEWSWDAIQGSMEGSCARAVEIGLPSIAFTEHVDLVRWYIPPANHQAMRSGEHGPGPQKMIGLVAADNCYDAPPLDVDGYLQSIERCRAKFPALRIVTGVELGEPHWFVDRCKSLLSGGAFERVLGSMHSIPVDGGLSEVGGSFQGLVASGIEADDVVRAYLADVLQMVESSDLFAVLAHIDYAARRYPARSGTYDTARFEDEYRAVLRALAPSGRALEVNTRIPLDSQIVRWWYEAGGDAITFGSDAHFPEAVATGFVEAAAMVEAQGFRPGRTPLDFWTRSLTR
jgi:histidinol-phosphatase (PHP family)